MVHVRRSALILAVTVLAAAVTGCASKHYMEVYIDNGCRLVQQGEAKSVTTTGGWVEMDPLWVFPGDYVSWINIGDDPVTLTFTGNEDVFGEGSITIDPGHRLTLPVLIKSSRNFTIEVSCGGGTGAPKVNVGDDP